MTIDVINLCINFIKFDLDNFPRGNISNLETVHLKVLLLARQGVELHLVDDLLHVAGPGFDEVHQLKE